MERIGQPTPTIQLNISTAFVDKQTTATVEKRFCKKHDCMDTCWAFGSTFKRATVGLQAFVEHIEQGRAWTLHAFKSNRRIGTEWQSAQLLALDLDNCPLTAPELADLPFIRDYAFLVYPSPSSTPKTPKTRVVFVLDMPITDATRWQALQIALMAHFSDLQPDKSCKDTARLFYGSTQPGRIVLGNILPATVAGGLTKTQAEQDEQTRLLRQQNPPRPIAANSTQAERSAASRLNRSLDELATTGTDRHKALIKSAGYLFGLIKGGWPLQAAEVERGIMDACARNGYLSKVGEREIQRCMGDMQQKAAPIALELPSKPTRARNGGTSASHARINGGQSANDTGLSVQYVSDILTPEKIAAESTLLIAAPVGMGKTRAIAEYVASLPDNTDVTGIAQFRLLTLALSEALKSLHYEDLNAQEQSILSSAERLVSSVSSLHKFNRAPGVVIADEIEGVLQFILNSGTFEGNQAVVAFQALRALVTHAIQFIGMDAGLSEITENLIRQWRGNISVKRYPSGRKLRRVSFLRDKHAAFWTIGKLLRSGRGKVYTACTSESDASELADLYGDGEYRVLKITRDTSNTPKVQAFIKNAHNERDDYDLVIYTSAAGAGVDFSNPVFAHVGIFGKEPLAPEQAIQLYGRVRNAQRYYAAVPPMNEPYPTPSADALLSDRLRREMWTAQQNGMVSAGGDYLEILKLWAAFKARALQESAQWRKYFAQRLQANGFSVQVNNARAPIAFVEQVKQWKVERADTDWQFIQDASGQALNDESLDKLRMGGVEITHDLKLRNIRAKIELALHHEHVTADDRDLVAYRGRKRLSWLKDMFTDIGDLLASDLNQSTEGAPLQKRKYRALNIGIVSELLKLAGFFGKTPETRLMAFVEYFSTEHPTDEINERFAPWITSAGIRKFEALGHRDTNARTPRGLCRFFCDLFGLTLESIRRGRADGRYRAYQLNADSTAYRIDRARRAASLREAEMCTQNMYIGEKHILGTPENHTFNTLFPASVQGDPPAPLSDKAQAAALFDAMRKANKYGNPFSKKAVA